MCHLSLRKEGETQPRIVSLGLGRTFPSQQSRLFHDCAVFSMLHVYLSALCSWCTALLLVFVSSERSEYRQTASDVICTWRCTTPWASSWVATECHSWASYAGHCSSPWLLCGLHAGLLTGDLPRDFDQLIWRVKSCRFGRPRSDRHSVGVKPRACGGCWVFAEWCYTEYRSRDTVYGVCMNSTELFISQCWTM